jgi:phosphinothricin acetyltransferase
MAVTIRQGESADLNKLVEIYNHYVTETHVTFDTTPFLVTDRIQWFNQFTPDGPYRLLVADSNGAILGYATSTRYKPREGYDTSVETTIYLDPGECGHGAGLPLYAALMDQLLADPAVHRAYGGIALPNDASVALHLKLGFERVGSYHEVGFKFDRYWDVDWFEKDVSGNG